MMHNSIAAAGVGCLVYSAFLIHPTLAWFVAGVLLLAIGVGGAIRQMRNHKVAESKE